MSLNERIMSVAKDRMIVYDVSDTKKRDDNGKECKITEGKTGQI